MSVSKEWIDSISKTSKRQVKFTNTIAIKWNHYGKEEWFTAVVDEVDTKREDGKIHHVLYVSDGKEEWIDVNKEDWRLLPKNWQDKEKKFLASRGKKRKKVDKKKQKNVKRPRKADPPTSGTLAYNVNSKYMYGSNGHSNKKRKHADETEFMPLTWDTSGSPKRVRSTPKPSKSTWQQSGGVDFSLPTTPYDFQGSNHEENISEDDLFQESPNSFEDFKGPRKLSISTSPEFSSSKDFDNAQITPMKKVKTKQKKKRKNKSKMVMDYEFIQNLYPKDLYFRRYNVISSNGRRFSFGYLYICPYGGFFTAWQKKSSRLVTLPNLSVVTRDSRLRFLCPRS